MDYLERSLHSKIRFVRDAGAMLLISTSSSDMMDGAPESEASLWGGKGVRHLPLLLAASESHDHHWHQGTRHI